MKIQKAIALLSLCYIVKAQYQYENAGNWYPYGVFLHTLWGSTEILNPQTESVQQILVQKSTNGCISEIAISSQSGSWTKRIQQTGFVEQKPTAPSYCSTNTTCLNQTLNSTQKIVEVIATANKHIANKTYGCIDTLTFVTNDNLNYSCNARNGTNYTVDDRPADSPYRFSFTGTQELAQISVMPVERCIFGQIIISTKDPCASADATTKLEISEVNSKSQTLITTTAPQIINITAIVACSSDVVFSLQISPTPTTTNLMALDSSISPTKIIFTNSTNFSDAKLYFITLQAKSKRQPGWTKLSTTVTYEYIDPCKTATITATAHPKIKTQVNTIYSKSTPIWKDSVSIQKGDPLNTQVCGTFSVALLLIAQPLTFDESDPANASLYSVSNSDTQSTLTVSPTTQAQIGDYTLMLTICLTSYAGVCKSVYSQFTVLAPPPCEITSYTMNNLSPLYDQTYILDEGPKSWSLAIAAQTTQNPACGYAQAFTVSVSSQFKTTASFQWTASSSILNFQLNTADLADAGTKIITVTATLQSYNVPSSSTSPPTVSKTFLLNLWSCIVKEFNMIELSKFDQQYTVMDQAQDWFVPFSELTTQEPLCGYKQFYTVSATPSFDSENALTFKLNGTGIDFYLYSQNLADAGAKTITLTSTLVDYYGPLPVPTTSRTIQVKIAKSCKAAVIVAVAHQSFTASVVSPASSSTPLWFDTYSGTPTVQSCGPLILRVTKKQTPDKFDDLTMSQDFYWSQNLTHSNLTALPSYAAEEGSYVFEFKICLRDFPTVACATFESNFDVSKCFITKYSMIGLSPQYDKVYTIGEDLMQWSIEIGSITKQTPACRYNEEFNVTFAPKMRSQDSFIWTISESSIDFQIYSQDLDDQMIITVTIQSTLIDYTQDPTEIAPSAKSKFTVSVITARSNNIASQYAPYFEYALETQAVAMPCLTPSTDWQFVFPKILDPNDYPVTAMFKFDQDFFALDNDMKKINLKAPISNPTTQTIEVTLTNKLLFKKKYSMDVRFFCQINPPKSLESLANQTSFPSAYIQKIESSGRVVVKFKQQMTVPKIDVKLIKNETIVINQTVYPIIKLQVVPGLYSDQSLLKFNWSFVDFKPTELILKLDFEHENYVSSNTPADQLSVTLYGLDYFVDTFGNYIQVPTILHQSRLPQMAKDLSNTQRFASAVQTLILTSAFGNLVVGFLCASPIQMILNSVKHVQIIIHTFMIQLAYPATTVEFFRMVMKLVTFQVYDFSNFYNKALHLNPDSEGNQPLNELFQRMGYGALYLVQNFGSLCWTLLITPVVWLATVILAAVSKRRFEGFRQKWANMMFFDAWIQFLNETYIFLAMCVCINCYYFRWHTFGDVFNSLATLVFGLSILAFPVFLSVFYSIKKNYAQIIERKQQFLAKFGSALSNLDLPNQGRQVLVYRPSQTLRKLLLSLILVFQQQRPVFNIFMVNFQSIAMVMIVGFTEPLIDAVQNRLELVNEAFNLVYTYHLYLFTDYMRDLKIRDFAGKILIFTVILNITVNLGVVVKSTMSSAIRKMKLMYRRYKERKAILKKQDKKTNQPSAAQNFGVVVENIFIEDQAQAELRMNQQNKLDKSFSSMRSDSSIENSSEPSLSESNISSSVDQSGSSQMESSMSSDLESSQRAYSQSESGSGNLAQTELVSAATSPQLFTLTSQLETETQLVQSQQQHQIQVKTKMPNLLTRLSENLNFSAALTLNPSILIQKLRLKPQNQQNTETEGVGPSQTIEPSQQVVIDVQVSNKNQKIELRETIIDGKPTSVQFYIDGILHRELSVQEKVIGQLKANENRQLLRDLMSQSVLGISAQVQAEVKSGKMQRTLNYYKKLRDNGQLKQGALASAIAIELRTDFGDFGPYMSLREKIELYQKLKKEEAQQRQAKNLKKFKPENCVQRFV